MTSKRSGSKSGSSSHAGSSGTGPVLNAVLLGAAVCYGLALLTMRGRLEWPPTHLLTSLYTVAGCVALVGPLVLGRGEASDRGLGELLWMTGGLLVWVFDAVAAARGQWRTTAWATPLGAQTMGMTILAVLLAGWRCRLAGRGWAWTNVTGWLLGLFWVGLAVASFVPSKAVGIAAR